MVAVVGLVAFVAIGAGVALAYFLFTGSTTLPEAAAASIPQGAAPTLPASPTNNTTISVTFSEISVNNGTAITNYNLNRYLSAGGAGTQVGSCSDVSHSVTCTDTSVPDGSYKYSYTAVLTGTNWSTESLKSASIVVDTTAPAVTVNAVSTPTTNPNPAFSGAYGTASGDIAAVSVTVYNGSGTGGTVVATPTSTLNSSAHTWSTSALSSPLPDGTYTVAARQTDSAGNTGLATSTFTVDTTGPVTPAPSVSAAVSYGSNPTYVDAETVTFTDVPTDPGSGVKQVSYYYCVSTVSSCSSSNGTLIGTSTASAGNYQVGFAVTAGQDGAYKVVAVASDNLNNTTTSSPTSISVDTTPPTVSRPAVNGHS